MRKTNLLFIGELSKSTGASIRSLRYYEKLGLLTPVFIDPDTNYRYYEFQQIYLVEIIQICIELDIKLNNLTQFIDGDLIDYDGLFTLGHQIAKEKLKTVEKSLRYINNAKEKINLMDETTLGEVFVRKIPEKYFLLEPLKSFDDDGIVELIKSSTTPYSLAGDLLEYGLYSEVTPNGITRYAFLEVTKFNDKENIRIIPGGEYVCLVSDKSEIENADFILKDFLQEKTAYQIIETEIFTSKSRVNNRLKEIRLIQS